MPMTKAQIETALDLFERFVEAHEAIAESAVMNATPTVISGEGYSPPAAPAEISDSFLPEPAQGTTDDSADDGPSLDLDTLGSDSPGLDLNDAKAVADFRTQLSNLLREYAGATDPDTALNLIEEVTGDTKFSKCPKDKLEELHDAVYDALNE